RAQNGGDDAGPGAAVAGRHDVFQAAQGAEEPQRLERAADAQRRDGVGFHAADVAAVEPDAAFVGPVNAGDDVEHRRLAGAVGPVQAGDGAALHVKVQV